ncbi:hypothetical protein Baya_15201 [Bagarius yarrelli]|uniref:Uncharacterized protein n=1 Tax=Bagarius yarrelli TaxID=175774 RepID=A0A556VB49_BAGYA|nr:hypothetical protein Baya_15201 [Bagarius yarrelli]
MPSLHYHVQYDVRLRLNRSARPVHPSALFFFPPSRRDVKPVAADDAEAAVTSLTFPPTPIFFAIMIRKPSQADYYEKLEDKLAQTRIPAEETHRKAKRCSFSFCRDLLQDLPDRKRSGVSRSEESQR